MKEVEREKLFNFLREMEFNRLLSQAISFIELKSRNFAEFKEKAISTKFDTKSYKCILKEKDLDDLLEIISGKTIISIDTETSSLNPLEADLLGISLSYQNNKAFYIPIKHKGVKTIDKDIVLKKDKKDF